MRTSVTRSAILFLALSLLYHSNLRPVASGDSLSASLVPLSVVLDGSLALDRFAPWIRANFWYHNSVVVESGGHWYSPYPIAGALLVTPLYAPLALLPGLRGLPPATLIALARVAEKFAATLLAALSAVLLLAFLRRVTTERWAWVLTLVFATATTAWSTASQALWQHTPGQLALIAALYALERWSAGRAARWMWICGAASGLAVMVRPSNATFVLAVAVALVMARAPAGQYARALAPVAVAGAALAAYNLYVFGRLLGGYRYSLEGAFLPGLAGLLFSPGRGLLIYAPVLAFAAAAFRGRMSPLLGACAAFCALHLAIVAGWPVWWGGYCWGPRLLSELAAPLVVMIALGTPSLSPRPLKVAFTTLALYSVFIQALGAYFYPKGHWDQTPAPVDRAPSRLWDWRDNPVARTLKAGPAWEPYAVAAAYLRGGGPAARQRLTELGINSY